MREKKRDLLLDKMKEVREKNNSLADIAKALKSSVQEAENVSFRNPVSPNLAAEPYFVGYMTGSQAKKLSNAIKGENAVFVGMVSSFNEIKAPAKFDVERKNQMRLAQSRSTSEAENALRESADIKDLRYLYY
jgi:hypothetical protein